MKHEYKAFFVPEHIDEQTDIHIEQQQDLTESASPPANTVNEYAAQQAIRVLQKHFTSPKNDTARLQRVWQRLELQRVALEIPLCISHVSRALAQS